MPDINEKYINYGNLSKFKDLLEDTYGTANNPAKLGNDGKLPTSQLPTEVFNVEEYNNVSAFPQTGEINKIYVDKANNILYRWNGSAYVSTSAPDSVKYTSQELTSEQKLQARTNIGAAASGDIPSGVVKYSEVQDLSTDEKSRARTNIGAAAAGDIPTGVVEYSEAQDLTTEQKAQARTNIGAAAAGDIPTGAVIYNASQSLTAEQQTQARSNIDAASATEVSGMSTLVNDLNDRLNNFGDFVREVAQTEDGIVVTHNEAESTTIPVGLDFNGGVVNKNETDNQYYLYLTKNDTPLSDQVFTPFVIPASGGGGGGAYITISNVVKPSTVRNGKPAVFSFTGTSSDDTDLTVKWLVDDVLISTQSGQSGDSFEFNAGPYLKPSADSDVKIIIDSEGNANLTRKYKVTSVAFAIAWGESIESIMLNTANTNVYVPIIVSAESGTINNVKLTIGQNSVSRTVTGSATITIALNKEFFASGINVITGSMVSTIDEHDKADDIHYTVIWATGVTTPIVAFANSEQECNQYDVANIEYFVYDPANEIATCTIKAGAEDPKTITANRQLQTYQYPALVTFEDQQTVKSVVMTLACKYTDQSQQEQTVQTTMTLKINKVNYDLSYYSDDSLVYNLDPVGHSNTDADREQFAGLVFNNFDWDNGGFITDSQGTTAFVVKKGNSVTLPRCLFQDSDANGKTIDISFRVANSDQYDAIAMKEINNISVSDADTGVILYANNGELRLSSKTGKAFRYCEDSRIDLSILVERNQDQRIATIWLDGIPSSVNKYSQNMLIQNQYPLVIGSEHCDVWVYGIRVYNTELTKQQMIQNYISEGINTDDKVNRYTKNTIIDNNDKITKSELHKVAADLTIVEIAAPRMTTSKKDPVPADVTITDGATVLELPAASGPETGDGTVIKVQGTSSAAYGRSSYNLDIDFKGTGKKYKISENAISVNYLNIKVNVASSENANNINAVDWYNMYQPYLTESRSRPGVRDTVEGKPCAVFIKNTNNEPVYFSSILIQPNETVLYAMGDLCNSKKNKAVFGQDGKIDEYVTHPTKACIEVSGNDTEPEQFRSTAAVYNPDDEEWQTDGPIDPDTGEPTKIKHFEWRMNPEGEYSDPTSEIYEVVTAWDNTVAWLVSTINNPTKFKDEVANYFAIDSLLYHFLFIEYYEGYDNVSKNTFYSYDWDETAQKYLWNIKAAYDMDTILAADNDGIPFGDYGIDYDDTIDGTPSGRKYFNAADNTIWVNLKSAFQSELSSMYSSLRSKGAWNSDVIVNKWNTYQNKRPHAAMVIDAFNKYIKPYKINFGTPEKPDYDDSYLSRLNGSKIYWRKQFLTYQTSYMDGKYGYYSTSDSTKFRTNCPAGTKSFEVKSYAKTYITFIKDSTKLNSKKVQAGGTVVFDNVTVGNNTTMYITPDRLIQYIRPLNETDNSTFAASGATKLMEAILGGETVNTAWDAGTGISIPSVILKDLSIRNMVNFSDSLNLSNNTELETLDTRGTNTGLVTLPTSAPLTTVQLNACTGVHAFNLKKIETFTMQDSEQGATDAGRNLTSIWVEGCNSKLTNEAMLTYLKQAVDASQTGTRRIRMTNVNWELDKIDLLYKIATTWMGYNALGEQQNAPVITGYVKVNNLSTLKLATIRQVWSEDVLTIEGEHEIITYTIPFMVDANTPIYWKGTQTAYTQIVDHGDSLYEPIAAGDIDIPVKIDPTGQYRYTYTGWQNLDGAVTSQRTVYATFDEEENLFTVRWFAREGIEPLKVVTDVTYGSELIYDDPNDPEYPRGIPTMTDKEEFGFYQVFKGWNKSTGYIKGNTDVYAIWDEAAIPSVASHINLKDMSIAQIYGIAKTYQADAYFTPEDYTDIRMGRDFDFTNVESQVLLEERYFGGKEVLKFDGTDGRPLIKLFDENAPSFTLAVDYEFTESKSNATLVSCYDANEQGSEGFTINYYNGGNVQENESVRVLWGDTRDIVAHGLNRGIVVIRHLKGSKNLIITSDNGGRRISHINLNSYGGDSLPDGTWETFRYDGYNDETHFRDLARAQHTSTDAVLAFGAIPYGANGYRQGTDAKGWIHWCKIWYEDLGEANATELASWSHEIWRMHYRGSEIYNKDDGTGFMDGASFIANAPLAQYYEMYKERTANNECDTTGGWRESLVRDFISKRCIKAFPYEWQSIIKPVSIPTKGGKGNGSNIEYTSDKIYIPARADMMNVDPSASGLESQEGKQIPWFMTSNDRVKFMGSIIPDNSMVYISPDDPTTRQSVTIKEGDTWIIQNGSGNNTYCYTYISQNTADKHAYICGRPVDDTTNNRIAQGSQGGMWIRSNPYWTRTNNGNDTQYTVFNTGNVSGNAWMVYRNYQYRPIVIMFSI